MFKKPIMIAAALATAIAFMPAKAQAGSKTGYFIGGIAAGVGGLLFLKEYKKYKKYKKQRRNAYYSEPAYEPAYYPAPRYYRPAPRTRSAPRVRYYQPVSNCRSTNLALRKLGRRGFRGFHNIRYKNYTTKVKAWRHGVLYQFKVNRCNGNVIWRQAI